MTVAVAFEGVTFAYPEADSPVVRDVSFGLPEGAFVLITGPTGSGKSTVLRAMNGLVPHFSGGTFAGRVVLHGRSTLDHAPRAFADVAAFVPQDPTAAFVVDRVEDELAYVLENLGTTPATMRRRVEEALDLLDIERLRARSVQTLSGGERQRVAIAAALTPGARVLLLDEPTSQLDPQGAEDVLAALKRLVDDLGVTVVAAEHRLERVAGFADLALGCRGDGGVIVGSPGEVFDALESGPPVARLGRVAGWSPTPLSVRSARRFVPSFSVPPVVAAVVPPVGSVLVAARGITAGYGGEAVLRDVELSVSTGEVVALIGRNGAGKTTLLRCLAGVHAPMRGEVTGPGGPPRPGHDVALCPQAPDAILFKDTVAGEVLATLDAHGGGSPEEILDLVGLSTLADAHPRDLSAGERLLVAIAATVATKAPVLLLDEPTRGLDEDAKKKLARFLRAFAAAGNGVAFASHDVELVARVADRVVMIAGGEVVADGSPRDVIGDSNVFSPQVARVLGPDWLTVDQVMRALEQA